MFIIEMIETISKYFNPSTRIRGFIFNYGLKYYRMEISPPPLIMRIMSQPELSLGVFGPSYHVFGQLIALFQVLPDERQRLLLL